MSECSSKFTEVTAGGVTYTPSVSVAESIQSVDNPTTPPHQSYSMHSTRSPSKVPGILKGNFAALDDRASNGMTIDTSVINPTIADAWVNYKYSSFRRIPVNVSFGFKQEPAEWHKVTQFVADVPALIRNTIEAMSYSEHGATKLLLVIIFSQAYYDNGPNFWEQVGVEAADQLFSFVGAPDIYSVFITGVNHCLDTAIKGSDSDATTYEVSSNGRILWINGGGRARGGICCENIGKLPQFDVSVL